MIIFHFSFILMFVFFFANFAHLFLFFFFFVLFMSEIFSPKGIRESFARLLNLLNVFKTFKMFKCGVGFFFKIFSDFFGF